MKIYKIITVLTIMLVGCNNEKGVEEQKLTYGEQIPQEEALSVISFVPKQINEDNSPFPIKKKSAILNKTDKQSEIIELRYGGVECNILLEVENTKNLKRNNSLDFEEMDLLNGENAYYAEDQYTQYISWVDNELSYLMSFHYKGNPLNKADVFLEEDILEIIDQME
ncbi:hypothetical protein [Evansella cellulosilytica]|uniref:DUF4367 domain-containing protein n=1 Tax=Evansella cellulosilytica (strain ATCC 21833 / DSM 2522 / FERM P-1141 / JCM 9156 / N-4) TaxID=649639 RepID=E6TVQ7_EVAC2|nr:hypothetical protein [Evansella cellulosilytica]ADU32185.1 hypothetical protein Bcell_3951 [Evansella cellulosilytica DSM 2522]